MSKKHLWSKKEDELLIKLKHELKMHKWVEIAQNINSHFEGQTLTGKQCRDRYINKLSQHLRQRGWDPEEDRNLMKLLETYGRRWSVIAQSLSGRSENSIKNHFYARLRRSIRELDKFIKRYLSSSYSTVECDFLNKILSISGHKSSENGSDGDATIQKANQIIKFLFWRTDYSQPQNIQLPELIIKIQLIQELGGITKIQETLKKQEADDYQPYHYFSEPFHQIKIEAPPIYFYNPYCYYF